MKTGNRETLPVNDQERQLVKARTLIKTWADNGRSRNDPRVRR